MLAAMSWAWGLVATPPLFLCCLPCRVTGIAGRLLFSLQQRISFCLFGRFARCLIGGRPRGVGCCLRSNLGLLCKFALLALPRFFTLHRALGSRGGDGLALLSFLDGGRPFDERALNQSRRTFECPRCQHVETAPDTFAPRIVGNPDAR